MSDPFRRLFLEQVEIHINREPSRDALLALLQLATPGLTCVGTTKGTQKAFKTLLARVHPDAHTQDARRATRLCQDAQLFYSKCLSRPTGTGSSPSNAALPLEFHAFDKWPHIRDSIVDENVLQQLAHQFQQPTAEAHASRSVAYQCINARGAIAHGRKIELKLTVSDGDPVASVSEVLGFRGGVKMLRDTNEIKEELTKNGPVVSIVFRPHPTLLNSNIVGRCNQFGESDILIIGWRQLPSGEVWIVHPAKQLPQSQCPQYGNYQHQAPHSEEHHIAVGQFGIDDCCVAPTNNFEDTTWQKGPYYDADIRGVEANCFSSSHVENLAVAICSMSELDPLFKEMGTTSFPCSIPATYNVAITVRNKLKKSHSRKANLESVQWNGARGRFIVQFVFVEWWPLHGNDYNHPHHHPQHPSGYSTYNGCG